MRSPLTLITIAGNMQLIVSLYANCTANVSERQARCEIHSGLYFLCNEEQPDSNNLTLPVSQGSSTDNANCSNVANDGTNRCAFMAVHFGDLLMCQNQRPVNTFEDIGHLAEEIIINSPLRFNPIPEQSQHYDVLEAYKLLQECKVVEEEYEFSEEILSNLGVYSACAREELTAAV